MNTTAVKTSRLPAGSTLEIAPGVHVAHPHAEANLPGMGDTRLGDTKAVTEYVKVTGEGDDRKVTLEQKPLPDEVKPSVLTVASEAHLAGEQPLPATQAATDGKHNAVDDEAANVS